jgi:hypothetical protein
VKNAWLFATQQALILSEQRVLLEYRDPIDLASLCLLLAVLLEPVKKSECEEVPMTHDKLLL